MLIDKGSIFRITPLYEPCYLDVLLTTRRLAGESADLKTSTASCWVAGSARHYGGIGRMDRECVPTGTGDSLTFSPSQFAV
jgi:hypothetical protein